MGRGPVTSQWRPGFTYEEFEQTPLWTGVEDVMAALEDNQDLEITTMPGYV